MREIRLRTDRHTQLVNITEQVAEALGDANGAAAALVYVPHTTAGVTINEHADPLVAEDLESAMEKVVHDDWEWKHTEDPGRAERAVARPLVAREHAGAGAAAGREARARPLAGDLLLRVRRTAR